MIVFGQICHQRNDFQVNHGEGRIVNEPSEFNQEEVETRHVHV